MATPATATLTDAERRALDRLVAALEREYGDDLHAVWLYGSRARGEPQREEGSDVDLLVITSGGHQDEERVRDLGHREAEREGIAGLWFSVVVGSPEWLAERRATEAFYVKEVDRDRIVLAGGEPPVPEGFTLREDESGAMKRSREYASAARHELELARAVLPVGANGAISHAYRAVLNAARAALSEEDRFARSHSGTWHLVRELLVDTGKLPAELATGAAALQPKRELAEYGPRDPGQPWKWHTAAEGRHAVEVAERFLAAVERLLGA